MAKSNTEINLLRLSLNQRRHHSCRGSFGVARSPANGNEGTISRLKQKPNQCTLMKTKLTIAAVVAVTLAVCTANSFAQTKSPTPAGGTAGKPNILVIWGDDIGWYNPSIYHRGDMGYWTPNIDRIGKEGAMFTCWYGQQSCTAGRAAFITGQSPIRTGLTKGWLLAGS
jgi:hypothetical protein